MTPTPSRAYRGERGHAQGRFLRRLTMVCFVVLVVSGLVVYWIGETTAPADNQRPPAAQQADHPDDKSPAAHQPARSGEGGADCGERA